MAENNLTIRGHLDQQIAEIDYWLNDAQTTFGNLGLLRILREHAVAALHDLDNADRQQDKYTVFDYLLVFDPVAAATPQERKRPPMTDEQREDVLLQLEHMRAEPRPPSGT